MTSSNANLAKLFALSSLGILLAACGGGSSDNNSTGGGGTTQPPVVNTDLFSVKAKEWKIQPAVNTSYCYDIDTQAQISCDGSDWDLKFAMGTRTPILFTNSGVSGSGTGGALYSPFDATWENLSKEKDATQAGSLPASAWLIDAYSNAFMDTKNGITSFFEYDLFGDHRMSPNFKTYLVTTDSSSKSAIGTVDKPVFAVQIYNYYQGATSGYISIRYINTSYPNDIKTMTIDATQGWSYVDLATGQFSNKKEGVWQFALNRYNVQLNTNIGAAIASQPAGFYTTDGKVITEKFKDANAYINTEADLKAAISTVVTKWGANTITSVLNPVYQGAYPNKLSYGWYNYYPTIAAAQTDGLQAAHMLKANSTAATMLRGNKGNSYARMHLKEISYADPSNASSATTWSFEFDVQPAK
ncbi:HmuY family protein [Acinetobacter sp. ANC 4648]|uniref:HmuY family protein n=1 Tax=Acinetobacter sp. ANC 4648 TaxID=1977875 RepID=UPI000A352300|nr:HmuY family protein [Acinetobacter sp. ANC 4648]OTG80294.1 hypothetical protein B9T27_13050 [Acinetobacter sp. ANC 4648]